MYLIIWMFQSDVTINYNKLHADPVDGKSLDIGKNYFFSIQWFWSKVIRHYERSYHCYCLTADMYHNYVLHTEEIYLLDVLVIVKWVFCRNVSLLLVELVNREQMTVWKLSQQMLVSKMLSIDNLDLVIIMYFYLAIIKELCTKTQTLVILLYHVFFSEKVQFQISLF